MCLGLGVDGYVMSDALLQGEPPGYEEEEEEEGPEEGSVSVVKMIGYDGNITARTMAESDAKHDTVGNHKHT